MGKNVKLLAMSRIAPKRDEEELDSVVASKRFGNRRAFHLLMEAQHYYNMMDSYRKERERNKRYVFGDQWGDKIYVDGEWMTEEQYIIRQGKVPLKNNQMRSMVRRMIGVYRSQNKSITCTARDRDEQDLGETISTVLQYNMQLNRMKGMNANTFRELVIGGLIVNRKSYGWRNGKEDCWTDYVEPNKFFVDNNMRDFRGWDATVVGQIHDVSFGQLCEQFATTSEDYRRLKDIYHLAANREYIASYADRFGYSRLENYDFLFTSDPGLCRVIEVWRKEQKPRYRCVDYLNGDLFKIDEEDYRKEVVQVNEARKRQAVEAGMSVDEVPLIKATWFVDDYWYFYFLTPFGDILREGETPYKHGEHPYVFKAYPFIDGEIHAVAADVIDQQRYVNRMVTMQSWIMDASAKGVLLMPEDCLPDGVSMEDIAESWAEFNGMIVYKPSKSGQMPKQVSSNSTNIGISDLLSIQLKFFDDISGMTAALQGKPGFSGQSGSHYSQQTENASKSLLDLLECMSEFETDAAYKDISNITQYYDNKRYFNISGKGGSTVEYDPKRFQNVEWDLSITESTNTPVYRQIANDFLMQLFNAQAISVEQLLENGNFPYADKLLQSIKSQREQLEQGKVPEGISPELMQQVRQGARI